MGALSHWQRAALPNSRVQKTKQKTNQNKPKRFTSSLKCAWSSSTGYASQPTCIQMPHFWSHHVLKRVRDVLQSGHGAFSVCHSGIRLSHLSSITSCSWDPFQNSVFVWAAQSTLALVYTFSFPSWLCLSAFQSRKHSLLWSCQCHLVTHLLLQYSYRSRTYIKKCSFQWDAKAISWCLKHYSYNRATGGGKKELAKKS